MVNRKAWIKYRLKNLRTIRTLAEKEAQQAEIIGIQVSLGEFVEKLGEMIMLMKKELQTADAEQCVQSEQTGQDTIKPDSTSEKTPLTPWKCRNCGRENAGKSKKCARCRGARSDVSEEFYPAPSVR